MRTIKFRARTKDGKKVYDPDKEKETDFVYGSLFVGKTKDGLYYTIEDEYCNVYEVDKDTICQYTGLKDENGDELYEGDTIRLPNNLYKVVYSNEICSFVLDKPFCGFDKNTPIGVALKGWAFSIME